MATPHFTSFTNHQNNPKRVPGHQCLLKTRQLQVRTGLLAAKPVALCPANFLLDFFFFLSFLQIQGFLLLLNLNTTETEEEIPNETLPFGCLKNQVLFILVFFFG